jgi:hypothetical protein
MSVNVELDSIYPWLTLLPPVVPDDDLPRLVVQTSEVWQLRQRTPQLLKTSEVFIRCTPLTAHPDRGHLNG